MPNAHPFSAPSKASHQAKGLPRRGAWRVSAATAALALALAAAAPAPQADLRPADVSPAGQVAVDIDKAFTIALPEAAATVFIANPDIADVQARDPKRVVVFGKKAGSTTVYVTTRSGRVSAYTVNVSRAGSIAEAVRAAAPTADLRVTGAANGVTISGAVPTPRQAEAVQAAAQQFLAEREKLNNNVVVQGETQVNLQVRIVEVQRSVSRSFGFNWNAISNNGSVAIGLVTGRDILSGGLGSFTRDSALNASDSLGVGYRSPGGSFNINGVIDALQSEGLVSILAEPNLTAASGEAASFLAGGEFPVPVAQNQNTITVEWKKFGVALDFVPTVLDPGRISIKVKPEVSEISDAGSVTINDITIPGITVRRAETTVELASGQSFAIAGLFQNNISSKVRQFPWLGDLPVLGPLFRSSNFTHDQSELVIIVTPYIVRPTSKPGELKTPSDTLVYANELEQVVYGKVTAKPGAPSGGQRPHLSGPAGFTLEDKR